MKRCDILSAIGIIAEFNPLHTGHKLLIENAKKHGTVVCVISSNFVQRGDTAILEKRTRAKAALLCGADLVVELPVSYSMSTAQNFALGGVSILDALGCESLIFGSECGDIDTLKAASQILDSQAFSEKLTEELQKGVTFAAARQRAAELSGVQEGILAGANNNLAIEYMTACAKIGSKMQFETIERKGAKHDSREENSQFVSASLLREKLLSGEMQFCKKYLPPETYGLFDTEGLSDIKNIENLILGVLRTKTLEELASLPDLSEGLENKLFSSIRLATDLDKLYNTIKVKRYTHARVRRLVLSAFLGIDSSLFMKAPPYIRVLGFNKNGEQLLRRQAATSKIPVVMRALEIQNLSNVAQSTFALECRSTDLYVLSQKKPLGCGLEYTANLIKKE